MSNQADRIQNAINHIKSAVDIDPWAMELAVEALEKELKNSTQEVKNSTDTISRQDAIDVEGIDEQIRCEMCRNPMHTDRGCDGNCKYDEKLYERIMQILDERIKPLSSAQPEQRWIPCSERLPEDEYVLVSKKPTKISGSKFSVAIATRTADPRSRKIQWRDSGFGIIQDDKVLAWMPLPEPYKGGEQNGSN